MLLADVVLPSTTIAGWHTFGRGEGLPETGVTSLFEDHQGRLWIGGTRSATVYDGYSWRTYSLPGLPTGMAEGPDGTVWISDEGGLFRVRGDSLITDDALSGFTVTGVVVDHDGYVWLSTHDGVGRFDGRTLRWYGKQDGLGLPDLIGGSGVSGLAVAPDGRLIASMPTGGLFQFNGTRWDPFLGGNPRANSVIMTIAFERSGALWVSDAADASGQIARFDGTRWETFSSPNWELGASPSRFSSLTEDARGRLWFAGGMGTYVYDHGRWDAFTQTDGLASNNTTSTRIDAHGNLWVGTTSGLLRFDGEFWQHPTALNGLPGGAILAACRDSSGGVWVADSAGASGVIRIDHDGSRRFTSIDGLATGTIWALLCDHTGAIWVGSSGGISRFRNGTWSTNDALGIALPVWAGGVRYLMETQSGEIWLVTQSNGMRRYEPETQSLTFGAYFLVPPMLQDSRGTVWTGLGFRTDDYGATGATFAPGVGTIWGFCEDSSGRIWVGGDYGTVRLDDGQVRLVTTSDGALTNTMTPLFREPSGALWFSATSRVALSAPENLGLARFDGVRWRYFPAGGEAGDILGDMAPLPTVVEAGGSILFGTLNGLVRYTPDLVAPRTVIVPPGPAKLSANRNPVLSLAAAFLEVNGIEFSTSLDGEPWSAWTTSTLWAGSGLPDGEHVLRARARDLTGNADSIGAEARFVIDATPPSPLIASPRFGDAVAGTFDLVGTASDPRMVGYKVEIQPSATGSTATTLWVSATPVINGRLASIDTHPFPDGDYTARLSVTDSLGLTGIDEVAIAIDNVFPFADETAPVAVSSSQGGDVYTTNREVHVYFPPHAFARDAAVQIGTSADSIIPPTLGPGSARSGAGFRLAWTPQMRKAALLDIAVSPPAGDPDTSSVSLALYHSLDGTGWTRVGGTRRAGRLEAGIRESGYYVVFSEASPQPMQGSLSPLSLSPRVFSPTGSFSRTDVGITFSLARSCPVSVRVYGRNGGLVKDLVQNQSFSQGQNVVHWDGRDRKGGFVPDGMYLVAVEALGKTQTKTLAVVK